MKKAYFLLLTLLCVVLVFCGCSMTESKKHSEIDEKQINNRLLYNKINNSVNQEYLKAVLGDDYITQYESVVLSENTDEIKKSLLEDIAICEKCEEKGIQIDEDSAKQRAKEEFDNLKKDSSQTRYFSVLENVLSENGLSETEYLDLLFDQSYCVYNRQVLKNYFMKNIYQEGNDEALDGQFQKYIDTLLK